MKWTLMAVLCACAALATGIGLCAASDLPAIRAVPEVLRGSLYCQVPCLRNHSKVVNLQVCHSVEVLRLVAELWNKQSTDMCQSK